MRTRIGFLERVGSIVAGVFVASACAAAASAQSTPTPSAAPIVPPRDAPAVRSTTPPFARATPASRPLPPDSIWLGNSDTVNVPIALHGGRPFIQTLIDGHPATVEIDTAALATMIDVSAADDKGSTAAISLQIGDVRFPRLQAIKAHVRSFSETYLGAPADAVIGRDLLQRYPVAFDFPNHALTIFRQSRGAIAAQPAGAVSVALRIIDGRPAIAASLDGQSPLWFGLNTGASYELQLDPLTEYAGRLAHAEHSIPFQEPLAEGDMSGSLVRAHALTVGSLTFNQPLVALMSVKSGQAKSELSGMMGAAMFSRLTLAIDEVAGSVAIVAPPGSTAAHFYDPSGITLAMRNGAIVIRSIVPGTPADVARMRAGDEIVTINGLAPATLDFAGELLDGSPGTKVVVAFRRWHILHNVTLSLHVII